MSTKLWMQISSTHANLVVKAVSPWNLNKDTKPVWPKSMEYKSIFNWTQYSILNMLISNTMANDLFHNASYSLFCCSAVKLWRTKGEVFLKHQEMELPLTYLTNNNGVGAEVNSCLFKDWLHTPITTVLHKNYNLFIPTGNPLITQFTFTNKITLWRLTNHTHTTKPYIQ